MSLITVEYSVGDKVFIIKESFENNAHVFRIFNNDTIIGKEYSLDDEIYIDSVRINEINKQRSIPVVEDLKQQLIESIKKDISNNIGFDYH